MARIGLDEWQAEMEAIQRAGIDPNRPPTAKEVMEATGWSERKWSDVKRNLTTRGMLVVRRYPLINIAGVRMQQPCYRIVRATNGKAK